MTTTPTAAEKPWDDRLALGLAGLWERTVAAHPAAAASPVRDIAYGGMWVVVRLENGDCGRAFAFTGAHEVYGPFDLAVLEELRELVGLLASEAFAQLLSPEAPARFGRLAQTVAVALLNAVAASGNEPAALEARGLQLLDDVVRALVRPGDRVAVVGAGMFLPELAACDAQVDVVDLRPACDLVSAHVTAEGVSYEPRGLTFYAGEEATPQLIAAADVLMLTGCTLVNGSFFDLMRLPRRARDVVLFGPSAGAPFEALAELGVTCVAGSWVVDGDAVVASTLGGRAARQTPREAAVSYVAAVPRVSKTPACQP